MSDTPMTDDASWHCRTPGNPVGADVVYKSFASNLERELNAAKALIKKREQIILELTAAGNCVESDKNNLAIAIRNNGGFADVQQSTDGWIKAKEWDRIEKGLA